jgi:hypothetical protein
MLQLLKKSLLTLFFLGMAFHMMAQDQQSFVYIQSEKSQPFYVRYDGKLIPSSDRGYLILPKMPPGTASLRIGFAKSEVPEQQYQVKLSGESDQGFLLKPDGSGGYALYNLQTFAMIKSGQERKKEPVPEAVEVAPVPDNTPVAIADATPAPTGTVAPPVSEEAQKEAMMASLKKDLDSTFPAKGGITVGPGSRPVKKSNDFSQALDKVARDDRPDDIIPDEPVTAAVAPAIDSATAVEAPLPTERKRKRRRDRDALTEDEQQLASSVLAEEHKAAATDVAATPEQPAQTPAPVTTETVTPAAAEPVQEATPVVVKKEKKQKKKKAADDPAFIDFVDTGGHQAPAAGSVAASAATTPAVAADATIAAIEEPSPAKKKKRSKLSEKLDTIDTTEHPNNIIKEDTGYAVSDLSIDHPKESRKDRKKKKSGEDEAIAGTVVAPPVMKEGEEKPSVAKGNDEKSSSLKMINSDCGKVMEDETFRKVLRKYVAGKDDDGMIDAFRKQTKGYCLETSQIRTLVQLLGSDESRYRLLDIAYSKAYHSDEYPAMENLLSDRYYKGRFRAMLNK